MPQGQILQTADGQLIILQSAEQTQTQTQQPQYVQVGGQCKTKAVYKIYFENQSIFLV